MFSILVFSIHSIGWYCQAGDEEIEISSEFDFIDDIALCKDTIKKITFSSNSMMKKFGKFRYSSIESIDFTNCIQLESLEKYSFLHCKNLTSVLSIPSTIQLISDSSFEFCTNLAQIDLSQCLRLFEISRFCFQKAGITSITFPNSLRSISEYSFSDCGNLKSITLDTCLSLTLIQIGAFYSSTITSITLPTSLNDLRRNVFSSSKLESIDLSKCTELKIISMGLFYFSQLSSISFPPSIEEIADEAFSYCPLTILDLGSTNLKSIGKNIVSGINSPITLTLPDSVEIISNYAFYYISFTNTTFKLPQQLRVIGNNAFENTNIQRFHIENGVSLRTEDGIIVSQDFSRIILCPEEKTDFQLASDQILIIEKYSFYQSKINYINLTKFPKLQTISEFAFSSVSTPQIEFPPSLRAILDSAFYNTYTISTIDLGQCSDLRFIGTDALYGMRLQIFKLPEHSPQLVLADFAFRKCLFLSGPVTIPNYITKIGLNPWLGESDDFTLQEGSQILAKEDIFLVNSQKDKILWCPKKSNGNEILVIPDSIQVIGSYSFASTIFQIINFTTTSKLHKIESYAFSQSDGLNTINLPNSLLEIGDYAFYYCLMLSEMTIPKSVQRIGENPWLSARVAKFIVHSESLAFSTINGFLTDHGQLKLISAPGAFDYFLFADATYIGTEFEKITIIGEYSFSKLQCSSLNLALMKNLESIQPYSFDGSLINEIILPPSVKNIFHHAFARTQISAFEIPKSLEFFDSFVFAEGSLESYVITESTHFALDNGILMNKNCSKVVSSAPYVVFSIGSNVFTGSDLLTTISKAAFSESFFDIIDLSSSINLQLIDDFAFMASNIKTVQFPSSISSSFKLGNNVFEKCNELDTIFTIPKSLNSVGKCVWIDSLNQRLVVEEGSTHFSTINGTLLNFDQTIIYGTSPINSGVFIGSDQIAEIKEGAFQSCNKMALINLSLTRIKKLPQKVFYNCSCKMISLPCKLKEIGENCFTESTICFLTIPDSATIINSGAFSCVNSLRYLKLPSTLINIPKELCSFNSNLQYLIIPQKDLNFQGPDSFFGCFSICGVKSLNVQNDNKLIESGMLNFAFTECEVKPLIPEEYCPAVSSKSYTLSEFKILGDMSLFILLAMWCLLY